MQVYLDYAATTPLDPAVLAEMQPYLTSIYGNPSSAHRYGREAKVALEKARKTVAACIGASPAEIYFTSGGTEANNLAIHSALSAYALEHVISSPLEHSSVINVLKKLQEENKINLHLVNITSAGDIDYQHLAELLDAYPRSLVALMHGNHELGSLTSLERVLSLAQAYPALVHTDAVQTMGSIFYDVSTLKIDFLSASAHKFYGPKGVGFLYIRSGVTPAPLLLGGPQERNVRAGTEAVANIVGLASALHLSYQHQTIIQTHLLHLYNYLRNRLQQEIPGILFFGKEDISEKLPHILSIGVPTAIPLELLLLNLDIAGIAVSAGSACNSGAVVKSPLMALLNLPSTHVPLRVSLGKNTTVEELDYFSAKLKEVIQSAAADTV